MPDWAEKKIKSRGGAQKWRTIKKGDKTMRCAVTKEEGPRGGKTVCYDIGGSSTKKSTRSSPPATAEDFARGYKDLGRI